ncbi:3-oxoadipate enol-lactonase [Paracoccus sp. MKU1]|uniref:3-oxoadipate enol-lactonase n=1 Tax=Paracoccus sp. MKU1 TaxID=1745182 RepID=UPI0007192610|nr:3-oxoadipate enol-lactonase [Paracoccus sp. MKU1]KRW95234.1 3-oxoadipate enol-lactonase [Paracoccus sp. MKU1]
MHMIQSEGLRLHVRADGPEQAPALLLLNSLGTDLRMWDAVAADLARDFRVIRFDKPGHGLSESAPRPFGMEMLARHALAVLDIFDVRCADILGLSIGGQIAMALAEAAPERVGRLVLSNTAARIGSPEMWTARITALEAGGLAAMADDILERWFPAAWRAAHPAQLAGWRAMLSRCDLQSYLGCCEALAAADQTRTCRDLATQVLTIAGGADLATPPEVVAATAALIEGAETALIENAGHLPCVDAPAQYLALLRSFLLNR